MSLKDAREKGSMVSGLRWTPLAGKTRLWGTIWTGKDFPLWWLAPETRHINFWLQSKGSELHPGLGYLKMITEDRSDISYLPVFGLLEHYLVFNTSTLILPGFPFIMNCYLLKKFFHLVFHLSNPSFICVLLVFIPSIDYSILSAEYLIPKYFYLFLI